MAISRNDAARHVSRLTGHAVDERHLRTWESQGLLARKGVNEEGGPEYSVWDIAVASCVAVLRLGPANMGPDGVKVALAGLDGHREKIETGKVTKIAATESGAVPMSPEIELAVERILEWGSEAKGTFYFFLPIRAYMLGLRFEPTAGPRGETVN